MRHAQGPHRGQRLTPEQDARLTRLILAMGVQRAAETVGIGWTTLEALRDGGSASAPIIARVAEALK